MPTENKVQAQREKALKQAEAKTLKALTEATNALGTDKQTETQTKLFRAMDEFRRAELAVGNPKTEKAKDERNLVHLKNAEYLSSLALKKEERMPTSPERLAELKHRNEVLTACKNDLQNTMANPQAKPNGALRNEANIVINTMTAEIKQEQAKQQKAIQERHLSQAKEVGARNSKVFAKREQLRQRQAELPEHNARAQAQSHARLRQMAGEMRANEVGRQQDLERQAEAVRQHNAGHRENKEWFRENKTSSPTNEQIHRQFVARHPQGPSDADVLRQEMARLPQGQPQPQQSPPPQRMQHPQPQQQQQQQQPQHRTPAQSQSAQPPEQSASSKELINKWGRLVENCVKTKIGYENATPDNKEALKEKYKNAKQELVSELKSIATTTKIPGLAQVAKSFQEHVLGNNTQDRDPGQKNNAGTVLENALKKLMDHFTNSIGGVLEKHKSFLPGRAQNLSNQDPLRQMTRNQEPTQTSASEHTPKSPRRR